MLTSDTQNAAYGALVLRLSLGIMFLAHGLLKLLVFTPAGTAAFFDSIGLPGMLGILTLWVEVAGGVLLIAGIGTRWVAAALLPVLAGSIIFAHWDAGWVFSNSGGGWEYPAFLMAASVAQVFLGSGAYALQIPALRRLAAA